MDSKHKREFEKWFRRTAAVGVGQDFGYESDRQFVKEWMKLAFEAGIQVKRVPTKPKKVYQK